MVYTFFNKKTLGGAAKSGIKSNQHLAEELHKPKSKSTLIYYT